MDDADMAAIERTVELLREAAAAPGPEPLPLPPRPRNKRGKGISGALDARKASGARSLHPDPSRRPQGAAEAAAVRFLSDLEKAHRDRREQEDAHRAEKAALNEAWRDQYAELLEHFVALGGDPDAVTKSRDWVPAAREQWLHDAQARRKAAEWEHFLRTREQCEEAIRVLADRIGQLEGQVPAVGELRRAKSAMEQAALAAAQRGPDEKLNTVR